MKKITLYLLVKLGRLAFYLLVKLGWLASLLLIKIRLLEDPESPAALAALAKKEKARRLEAMRDVPRYPPFMKGLPVCEPLALLDTQEELKRGVQQLIADPALLEAHYYPAMLRLAHFVHMLPASQTHHHRGAGGLFRHSLEVGLWSVQQTRGKLIRGVITPLKRRLIEPRWLLAAFLAGICHDLGKVVTDFTVTDSDGKTKWQPYMQDLYQWAVENKIESYFIHWTEGRGKNHTSISSTLLESVVSRETLNWIGEGSTDVMLWLTESLSCNPGPANQIHSFVVKADQLSVERDLKTIGAARAGYDEMGVPIEGYLSEIMRRLVREGLWRINEPGARVWNIEGTTYLIWPLAGEEIANRARDENMPGLPKTEDGILDMLVERGLAFLRKYEGEDVGKDAGYDPFFYIAPDVITEKMPTMRLQAIRMQDQALVSSMPIEAITGTVHSCRVDKEIAAVAENEQVGIVADTKVASEIILGAPIASLHDEADVAQSPGGYSLPTEPIAENNTDVVNRQSVTSKAVERLSELPVDAQPAFQLVPSPSVVHPEKKAISLESLDGAVGEAIRVLAAEFKSGQKSFAELGSRQADGSVYLKWPATFASYGLTGKVILDYLTEKDWLIPASDTAKIGDAQFSDGVEKALGLTRDIGELFSAAQPPKPSGKEKTKAAPVSVPVTPARMQVEYSHVAALPTVTAAKALIETTADADVPKETSEQSKPRIKGATKMSDQKKQKVANPKAGQGQGQRQKKNTYACALLKARQEK